VAVSGAPVTDAAAVFTALKRLTANAMERAAAKSLIADSIDRDITDERSVDALKASLAERIRLAEAVVSIGLHGILTKRDREKGGISAQQSIDIETAALADLISLSQVELGPSETAEGLAGLLEHQAMSVRMEKQIPGETGPVAEKWLQMGTFTTKEWEAAAKELEIPWPVFTKQLPTSVQLQNLAYKIIIERQRAADPRLKKLLAERAANSAIFIGPTTDPGARSDLTPEQRKQLGDVFEKMGLLHEKPGSHEVRESQSMPHSAIEHVLLPSHMSSFETMFKAALGEHVKRIYVSGTHEVKVSWSPATGLPQVSLTVDSPAWADELKRILADEERVFTHVTRPLAA
jgi:hypothetical protein